MNKSSALLYYTQPADCWEGALPLGNGRLGAMAYGGTEHEELALNEDTLWSGLPEHAYSGKVFENLPVYSQDGTYLRYWLQMSRPEGVSRKPMNSSAGKCWIMIRKAIFRRES